MHGTYTFFIFPPISCLCGWFYSCYGEGRSEWVCKFSAAETEITAPSQVDWPWIGLCPAGLTGRMLDAAFENPQRGTGLLHFTSLKPDHCHFSAPTTGWKELSIWAIFASRGCSVPSVLFVCLNF